ncbi:chordin-like isoform X3 [Limulus polyphemus]|uniref:Chordin-like isoform X3 n=1 Tax=Limulus polyphemus TaxID=6850 RepID=A0ABM1T1C5_LIMPO|nr:chordin-like isoform X3 [Limulus polyphemus]
MFRLTTPHILFILWVTLWLTGLHAGKYRNRPPIKGEKSNRRISKQTHCQLGNGSYEIEERWRPDLGPPFGILHCVHCECIAVQRKKKFVARPKCKNIKNFCPTPTCDTPVLLPEHCCKTCPSQGNLAGLEEDLATKKLEEDDDDRKMKELTVLLTGKALSPPVPTEGAARGYFTYMKRNLHYTIHYVGMERPTWVRFTDENRNILEEHKVAEVNFHIEDSKICGVWRDVPKVYRRKLMKGRLYLLLATNHHPDGLVFGRFVRAKEMRLKQEVYSSVLLPDVSRSRETIGGGGIASVFLGQEKMYLNLEFNGIFTHEDARNVNVLIRLHQETSLGTRELLTETFHILSKVDPDYNAAEIRFDLTKSDESMLSRGKLILEITSADGVRVLSGRILPKTTCNIFQAILTTRASEDRYVSNSHPTGFAVLSPRKDGSVAYSVYTERLSGPLLKLALKTAGPTNADMKTLSEVDKLYIKDSWTNGTFSNVSTGVAESLLLDDLHLHLPTMKHRRELIGRIRQRLYTEAFLNGHPFLLHGNNSATGQVWLYIDSLCHLHYEVFVSGIANDESLPNGRIRRHLVELMEVPINHHKRNKKRVLKKFDGEEVGDILEDLTRNTFANLDYGKSSFLVTTKTQGFGKSVELETQLNGLPVPENCYSHKQKTGSEVYFPGDSKLPVEKDNKCYFEKKEYEDGYQWLSPHDACVMCFCKRGKIECDKTVCPPSECESPITVAKECCPMCPDNHLLNKDVSKSRGCYFHGDKKFHLAGTRWHPYIPPFGFSRCAICKCDAKSQRVMCRRKKCPVLPCAEDDTYREHPLDCCKKCKKNHRPDQLGDEAHSKNPHEILAAGGCRFRGEIRTNGSEWHPTVQPWGEITCINCHCKDGRARCKRMKCPKLTCVVKVHPENECCSRCLDPSEIKMKGNLHHQGWRRRRRRDREEH